MSFIQHYRLPAMFFGLSALLLSGAASASLIAEAEVVASQTNNTSATAEAIAAAAFTQPEPAAVFPRAGSFTASINATGGVNVQSPSEPNPGVDVDFFSFSTLGAGANQAILDIDNPTSSFDTVMFLFNSLGVLIAGGDDTDPADTGSPNNFPFCTESVANNNCSTDSLIGEILLAPGQYFVAVSAFFNAPTDSPAVLNNSLTLGGQLIAGTTEPGTAFPSSGNDAGAPYTLHISLLPESVSVASPGTLALMVFGLLGSLMRRNKRTVT